MSTMSTMTRSSVGAVITAKQKVGLVLCGLYSLNSIPSFLEGGAFDGDDGPPQSILVFSSILGLVGLVAAVLAWRGNRVALRVAAGAIILETITGLPAFFVDVPMAVKALVALSVIVTVVAVVLMFSTDRRSAPVVD